MKKIFIPLLLLVTTITKAQQFIHEGSIEYEVKINNFKVFGESIFAEMLKDKMPQFSNTYYKYTFSGDKGLYKFDRFDEKTRVRAGLMFDNVEDNTWYSNYTTDSAVNLKFAFDNNYILEGPLMNIEWRLSPNETREIAGFTCRKATGIVFDSVYVFAFYTDEITTNGGPMGLHGLPGMILGVTIPRMFTSWIATRVQVNAVDTKKIVAPKGKKKDPTELKQSIIKATKDWGDNWGEKAIWQVFL